MHEVKAEISRVADAILALSRHVNAIEARLVPVAMQEAVLLKPE